MGGGTRVSPNLKARMAGTLYVFAVVAATVGEFIVPGRLGVSAIVIPVSCYMAVTLLLYAIFKPVNRSLSLLAAVLGFVGLTFEALQLQPRGVNVGMVLHGFFCLLIGCLIFRSTFVPRILGVLMSIAGLIWLIYFSPSLARVVSPYNSALGLVTEASLMLWLLAMGVNPRRWEQEGSTPRGQ
jgi:Domain of unknown function (DUF4386)